MHGHDNFVSDVVLSFDGHFALRILGQDPFGISLLERHPRRSVILIINVFNGFIIIITNALIKTTIFRVEDHCNDLMSEPFSCWRPAG